MFPPASKTCFIGDLNQDLLTSKDELLVSLLSNYNLRNYAEKPTHFQENSSSLIDVCFLKDSSLVNSCLVVPCPFSNHGIVSCSLNFKSSSCAASTISDRVLNETNLPTINDRLSECAALTDLVDTYDDVNDILFVRLLLVLLMNSLPLRNFVSKKILMCRG